MWLSLNTNMLPTKIVYILTVYDIWGYNTGSSKISKHRNIACFINFVHILLAIFLLWFTSKLVTNYYSVLTLTEAISEGIQYSTALYTYCFIIFDSIIYQHAHRNFWKLIEHIDVTFSSQQNLSFRSYKVKIIIFLIKVILTFMLRVIVHPFVSATIDSVYVTVFIICEVRMFYYLFCLDILFYQFEIVDNELKTMISSTNYAHKSEVFSSYRSHLQQFKWIRKYFHCIHKLVHLLNKMFGWSQVAAISFSFYYLLTELNWYFIHFFQLTYLYQVGKHLSLKRNIRT